MALELVGAQNEVCMAVFRVKVWGDLADGHMAADMQRGHKSPHTPRLDPLQVGSKPLAMLLLRGPSTSPHAWVEQFLVLK